MLQGIRVVVPQGRRLRDSRRNEQCFSAHPVRNGQGGLFLSFFLVIFLLTSTHIYEPFFP